MHGSSAVKDALLFVLGQVQETRGWALRQKMLILARLELGHPKDSPRCRLGFSISQKCGETRQVHERLTPTLFYKEAEFTYMTHLGHRRERDFPACLPSGKRMAETRFDRSVAGPTVQHEFP